MSRSTLRATLLGVGLGGGLFLAAGLYLNLVSGAAPLANAGPLGAFTLIGVTVGGLTGPLLRGLFGGGGSESDRGE